MPRIESDQVGLIFGPFSSNEIQNAFRISSETDSGMARNSSDSLGMNFNPILLQGLLNKIIDHYF